MDKRPSAAAASAVDPNAEWVGLGFTERGLVLVIDWVSCRILRGKSCQRTVFYVNLASDCTDERWLVTKSVRLLGKVQHRPTSPA